MAGMRLRVGARTHVGRVRPLNEDVYRLRARQGLFVVCDGIGGGSSGEHASRVAGDTIMARLAPADADVPVAQARGRYLPRTSLMAEAVRCSNKRVYDRARRDRHHAGMGTTVVSAWIAEHVASIAHVGDSRAYLWYGDRLVALTCDHSLASANDDEDALVRALGREPEVDVDLTEVPVRCGDYLVLCSDGLTRMVPEAAVARVIRELRDPQRICDRLVDIANGNGGVDNITVVVVQVMGSWWQRIEDFASTNGTFVNGKRVRRHKLQDGDAVGLGKSQHTIVFDEQGGAGEVADAAPPEIVAAPGETVYLGADKHKALLDWIRSAQAPAGVAVLRVLEGRADHTEYPLDAHTSVIGKSDAALVRLRGLFKPKEAVAIARSDDGYVATVLRGTTRINKAPIRDRRVLADGDVLEVGGLTLEFKLAG